MIFGRILKNIDKEITTEASNKVADIDPKYSRLLELEKKEIINQRYIYPAFVIAIFVIIAIILGLYFHIWDPPTV